MKIALAIAGAVVGACAAVGAVCFVKYARSTDTRSFDGFINSLKSMCPCHDDVDVFACDSEDIK